jgi:hypothetical protein
MSQFLFEDVLPIIRCNSMQKVLMVYYQKQVTSVRVKPKQRRVLRAYGAENENACGGKEFCSSLVEDHRALATFL